jgi:pyridoxal phosphate enzyme (YggS family)
MSTAAAPHAVAARLAAVRDQIDQAARRAARPASDVTLVAVSKTFGPEAVRDALDGGVTDLGENRVQEAEEKVPAVARPARWHLIGHLQSNKVNKAIELFELIQSVDSVDLARAIGDRAARRGAPMRVLLQVNVAGTQGQTGFASDELRSAAPELASIEGLSLDGLMCIAPLVEDAEETRPSFRQLAQLKAEVEARMHDAGHPWSQLSMGMSNDFPIAVEEGATLVRVGRAIFGNRG